MRYCLLRKKNRLTRAKNFPRRRPYGHRKLADYNQILEVLLPRPTHR